MDGNLPISRSSLELSPSAGSALETPWLIARRANTEALKGFVAASLASGNPDRIARAAAHVRRQLAQLSAWANREESEDDPCPAHLLGLTAFDLADAAEELEAQFDVEAV